MVSSSASRVCTISGKAESRARPRYARGNSSAAARAGCARNNSRARFRRCRRLWDVRARSSSGAAPSSGSFSASCGWHADRAPDIGKRSATAATPAKRESLVPIETQTPTPAAFARATTSGNSAANSGKSRWQWLSTSIGKTRARLQSAAARNGCQRARRRQDRLARLQMQRRRAREARHDAVAQCDPAFEIGCAVLAPRCRMRAAQNLREKVAERFRPVVDASRCFRPAQRRREIGRRRAVDQPLGFGGELQAVVARKPAAPRRASRRTAAPSRARSSAESFGRRCPVPPPARLAKRPAAEHAGSASGWWKQASPARWRAASAWRAPAALPAS